MRGAISTLTFLFAFAAAAPAFAQARAMDQFRDWGTYSYQADGNKVCYVMSVPKEKRPASLDHGDIFFFVSQKPGQGGGYEPQFIAAYDFQSDSKVTVTVGDATYSMFTRGKSAWLEDAGQGPQLVAAMKAGADMSVSATSGRGNPTSYSFSLFGLTDALNSISECK